MGRIIMSAQMRNTRRRLSYTYGRTSAETGSFFSHAQRQISLVNKILIRRFRNPIHYHAETFQIARTTTLSCTVYDDIGSRWFAH